MDAIADRFAVSHVLAVDPETLRSEVRDKYRAVALDPTADYHFHTGRTLAEALGYSADHLDALPESAVAAFAGIANPIDAGPIPAGANVVDVGSGGGFDSFGAALRVGRAGQVIGVDMTPEMVDRATAASVGFDNVEFRQGIAEDLPVPDGWADVVISNGVINLVVDKAAALAEINRVLRPGGILQFADIANGKPVPEGAVRNIDLWAA